VYVSLRGEPAPHTFVSIIARATGDRASIVSAMREAIRKADPDVPAYAFRTMDEVLASSRWRQRVFGLMFGMLAGIALLLASMGLYAVTGQAVTHRTPEIGVRMALGAEPLQVVWLFVRRMCILLSIGMLLGLAGAIVLGRQLQQVLVRTAPTDPLT